MPPALACGVGVGHGSPASPRGALSKLQKSAPFAEREQPQGTAPDSPLGPRAESGLGGGPGPPQQLRLPAQPPAHTSQAMRCGHADPGEGVGGQSQVCPPTRCGNVTQGWKRRAGRGRGGREGGLSQRAGEA